MSLAVNITFEDRITCLDMHGQGQLNLNEVARQYVAEEYSLRVKHCLKLNGVARSFQHA